MSSSAADRREGGFTLIELLLAAFLAVFAGAVCVAVLSQGSRVIARVERLVLQEEMAFMAERLTSDLSNAVALPSAPFGTGSSSLSFVSIDPGASAKDRPDGSARLVRYWYEEGAGVIWRAETPFLSEGQAPERKEQLIRGLHDFRFVYATGGSRMPSQISLIIGLGKGRRSQEELRIEVRPLCGYVPA